MKFTRVSESKPSLRSLARGQNALHDCFEDHREKTAQSFQDMATHVTSVDGRVESVQAEVATIKDALGIGTDKRSTLATMGRRTAIVTQAISIVGGGLGLIGAYKLAVALWPALMTFLVALNHAVLTT